MNRTVVVSASKAEEGGTKRVRLNTSYLAALESAGLVPLIVPPLSDVTAADEILSGAAGLVLTGGGDVDPSLYGEPMHPKGHPPQRERDDTEIALVRAARKRKVPLLGICRGPQVINVALGGSLIQDIPSQVPDALRHNADDQRGARIHDVAIDDGSRLAGAVGSTRISVNSLHHQAVATVAPTLKVTARAPDGVVEGLESDDDWWMLAVQWHPEELDRTAEPWDRGLFAAFAAAVKSGG